MATVTRSFERAPDTREVSGRALDGVIDDVLRPVPPLMRRLMSRHLTRAVGAVRTVFPGLDPMLKRDPYLAMIGGAVRCIERAENRIQEIDTHLGVQEAALRYASTSAERESLYLDTLQFLRRTPEQLRGDRAAFGRFMDWEAILELARRAQRSARRFQQTLVFLSSRALSRCGPDRGRTPADVMEKTGFLESFHRAMQLRLPVHLEREWIDALVSILRANRNPKQGIVIDPAALHALAVRAQNPWADTWVQCSALQAWLLASPVDALRLARQRLRNPDPRIPDDIFVRRFLIERGNDALDEVSSLDLVQAVLAGPDPSPYVRQGAILALGARDADRSWPLLREYVLMREEWDPVPEVRAAISLTLGRWALQPHGAEIAFQEWRLLFEREEDPMPLRVAIRHAGDALEQLISVGQFDGAVAEQFALELVAKGVQKEWSPTIRSACEDLLERVRVASLPGFASFRETVMPLLVEQNREGQVDIQAAGSAEEEEVLGRLLAWLSRRTYGLYALPRGAGGGWRVTVGHQKRWRLWRWIHETLNPAPDKRQAHSHVVARRYEGTIRAHPLGLGEESPTKVPGEPVQMPAEGGWRRFLPLPDDFLDALEFGSVKVFSSEGVVRIDPPQDRRARWRLRWAFAKTYASLAALREQSRFGNAEIPPNAYIQEMRRLGFAVAFQPHAPPEHSWAAPYFAGAEPAAAPEEAPAS
ncbi:MAG: hypothetical protein HUU15_00635 [Candidatus Brocadiae bacterium]|nr:hypothetical protein [Candidatus Brocadiia bacterium]